MTSFQSQFNHCHHPSPYHISRLCGLNLPTIRSCLIRFPPSHTPDSLLLRFALAVLMKFPLSLRYVSVASVDTLSGMSCPSESRCGGGGLGVELSGVWANVSKIECFREKGFRFPGRGYRWAFCLLLNDLEEIGGGSRDDVDERGFL